MLVVQLETTTFFEKYNKQMRRKYFSDSPISIETCYVEGLSRDYFPVLLNSSGNKFVYGKVIDEETNEITQGFFVCNEWHHTPVPLNIKQQLALDYYFFNSFRKAAKYARENGWQGVNLVQLFPCVAYELLPPSVNVSDDGNKLTKILELWDDEEPTLIFSKKNDDGTLADIGNNRFERYVINIIKRSYRKTFIDIISKEHKAYIFKIYIPIINSQIGEYEYIKYLNCSWRRIKKIASYYCQFGLVAIFLDYSNYMLWAGCLHKSLPIPFTQSDIEEIKKDWRKMVYDNPYLEHTFFEGDNLTKWDWEIIKKARAKMKQTYQSKI